MLDSKDYVRDYLIICGIILLLFEFKLRKTNIVSKIFEAIINYILALEEGGLGAEPLEPDPSVFCWLDTYLY